MTGVTPFVGVWIEIMIILSVAHNDLQVTPFVGVWIEIISNILIFSTVSVTPYAGVWIEIWFHLLCVSVSFRHSLRGSVDWNICSEIYRISHSVTPYAGVWIEITGVIVCTHSLISHSLRGSVDWNLIRFVFIRQIMNVTPYAGVWIEIRLKGKPSPHAPVTPYAGVWIEMYNLLSNLVWAICHSLRGSVDWNIFVVAP